VAGFTRKQLKSKDAFVTEVGGQLEFFAEHRNQVIIGAALAVAGVLGVISYNQWQGRREIGARAALNSAVRMFHGSVTTDNRPGFVTYTTSGERQRRSSEALQEVIDEYGGRVEAAGAAYYLALLDIEQDKMDEAKGRLKIAIDDADENYQSLARLSLADLLSRLGESSEAEAEYRALVDNPTRVVPATTAKLSLARHLAKTDVPAARTLLEELMAEPGPLSVAASATLRRLGG